MTALRSSNWRLLVLLAVSLAAALGVFLLGPIAQDLSYHQFADRRTILGVANFWNVVSNLPFVWVGAVGVAAIARGNAPGSLGALRANYLAFFAATPLVGLGSAYYHWAPSNSTLFWDRLPMTLAFMAFFSTVVGEHLDPRLGRRLLVPLLAAGLGSVLYWHMTELAGHGDLRPYILVQYLPILLVPLILWLFPGQLVPSGYTWSLLATYAVAKVLELLDGSIYAAMGLSGHTWKHLAAAGGLYLFVVAVQARAPTVPRG